VCLSGSCVPAFGQRYRVVAAYALRIPGTNEHGEPWDAPDGLPDPFIAFWVNRDPSDPQHTGVSDPVRDSLNPEWYWSAPREGLVINEGASLEWVLYDDDEAEEADVIDGVMSDTSPPEIRVEWLRQGVRYGGEPDLEVVFLFTPF